MANNPKKEIWAFGGGKGGVGKSVITTNIALALSRKGRKVVILDADYGCSNIHTYLGMNPPRKTLYDFIVNDGVRLEEVVSPTPYENVFILGGGEDSLKVSNLKTFQIDKLSENLEDIEADYLLIDLGAGTTVQTVDTFIKADRGILVTMPEPPSIENTYRFIKYSIIRKIITSLQNSRVKNYLGQLMDHKLSSKDLSPGALINRVSALDPESGKEIKNKLEQFNYKLILNQVRNNSDVRLGFSISSSCQKHFGIRLDYTGFVESDDNIQQSSRMRIPVLRLQPFAKSSRGITKIAENLETNSQIVTAIL